MIRIPRNNLYSFSIYLIDFRLVFNIGAGYKEIECKILKLFLFLFCVILMILFNSLLEVIPVDNIKGFLVFIICSSKGILVNNPEDTLYNFKSNRSQSSKLLISPGVVKTKPLCL